MAHVPGMYVADVMYTAYVKTAEQELFSWANKCWYNMYVMCWTGNRPECWCWWTSRWILRRTKYVWLFRTVSCIWCLSDIDKTDTVVWTSMWWVGNISNLRQTCLSVFIVLYLTVWYIEVDIWARLDKAALVFHHLNRIWSSHSINSTIKFRLYASVVLSTALHACETWKSTASIRNTLYVFHRRCIRKILGCRGKIVSPTRSWWEDLGCKPCPR